MCTTALPKPSPPDNFLRGIRNIRGFIDDCRFLAAQLKQHRSEMFGCRSHDNFPDAQESGMPALNGAAKGGGETHQVPLRLPVFSFSANHLTLLQRRKCRSCAVFLMLDHSACLRNFTRSLN
jgi:hypothetical protein